MLPRSLTSWPTTLGYQRHLLMQEWPLLLMLSVMVTVLAALVAESHEERRTRHDSFRELAIVDAVLVD